MLDHNQFSRFVVLGCGHSGSTLVSGILYFSNFRFLGIPTPTFECRTLNHLNDVIIEQQPSKLGDHNIRYFIEQLEARTRGRWCIKDPLLPFTIARFLPHFPFPPRILYIFRNPENNVEHLVRKMKRWHPYINIQDAQRIREQEWLRKNQASLDFMANNPEIPSLWIDYDELLTGNLNSTLNAFVGQQLNFNFITPSKRKASTISVSDEIRSLYREIATSAGAHNAATIGNASTPNYSTFAQAKDRAVFLGQHFAIRSLNRMQSYLRSKEVYIRPPFPGFQHYLDDIEARKKYSHD